MDQKKRYPLSMKRLNRMLLDWSVSRENPPKVPQDVQTVQKYLAYVADHKDDEL